MWISISRRPIRRRRSRPRRGPERNPDYLAHVRRHPCAACGTTGSDWNPVEAAHAETLLGERLPRGMRQKTTDKSCFPLCHNEHTQDAKSYHRIGEAAFMGLHGLDLAEIQRGLLTEFEQRPPGQ